MYFIKKKYLKTVLIFLLFISSLEIQTKARTQVIDLGEVIVTPSYTILDRTVQEKFLTSSEADEFPLIDNDILRAVQVFPGVTGNDFSARFNVRGGEKDETLVLLDGMELYSPYHLQDFGGAISLIDISAVSKAELIPGAYPVIYGDKLSGVVDLKSTVPKKELEVAGGIDLLNTHLTIKKKPFFISARRGYIDLLMGMMDSEESFMPRYWDIFGKYTFSFSEKNKIRTNILIGRDTNSIDEEGEDNDINSKYDNSMGWLQWNFLNYKLYLFRGSSLQRKDDGIEGKDNRDISYSGIKAEACYQVGPDEIKTGLQWQRGKGEYDYIENIVEESDTPIAVDTNIKTNELKGYVSNKIKLSSLVAANLGIRLIHQQETNKNHLGSNISAVFMPIKDRFTLRGGWGIYYQPVNALNLPVEENVSEIVEPEKAVHYIFGTEYIIPKPNIKIRLDAYYKDMKDLAGQIKDYGSKAQLLEPVDSGYSKGVEVSLDHNIKKVFYNINYTYSVAKERYKGKEYYRDFDQRHTIGLNCNYRFSKKTSLFASWRFHTGNPYTKRESEDGELRYLERNSARLPSYHSLDVRLSRKISWQKWSLTYYIQILNLYNHQNVHEYIWIKKQEDGYVREEEHFLPIMPSFGIEFRF
ncbi:MAG: TonB-dependent receptor plug domain-containing protein [Elusimicrobiota bacterium]